jgi:hypothetical protein
LVNQSKIRTCMRALPAKLEFSSKGGHCGFFATAFSPDCGLNTIFLGH